MAIHHQIKRLIVTQPQWSWGIASVLVLVIVIVGIKIIFFSHAGSIPTYVSAEAESGNRSGGAQLASSAAASGGSYVLFTSPTPTPPPTPTPSGTPTGNAMCGFKTGTPTINKVMIIWEENENASAIIGNGSLPYFNSVANNCGLATNYSAYTHPSLPNYMTTTSGVGYAFGPWNSDCDPGGTTSGSSCTTNNASIFSQLGANWNGFAESMTSNCSISPQGPTASGGTNEYQPRHNPAVYYTNIRSTCLTQDLPLGTTSSGNLLSKIGSGLLAFTTVTPNLDNDWHDGSASQMDNWLKGWIPKITAGSDYQNGNLAILIVWDEGSGSGNVSSKTTAAWMSPYTVPGTKSGTAFDEYSVLKTTEDLVGVPELNSTVTNAASMASAFNL